MKKKIVMLGLVGVLSAIGCGEIQSGLRKRTTHQESSTTTEVYLQNKVKNKQDGDYTLQDQENQQQIIRFTYGNNFIQYRCGGPGSSFEEQSTIRQEVQRIYTELSLKGRGPRAQLDFTQDVIDRDSDYVITSQELGNVDRVALKPNAAWTKRYSRDGRSNASKPFATQSRRRGKGRVGTNSPYGR